MQKNISLINLKEKYPQRWVLEITGIITVLSKLSERINDVITLIVYVDDELTEQKITYPIDLKYTFHQLYNCIEPQLRSVKGAQFANQLTLQWIPENDDAKYEIKITDDELNNISFHCQSNAFWETAFFSAKQYLCKIFNDVNIFPDRALKEVCFLEKNEIESIIKMGTGAIMEGVAKPELLHLIFENTVQLFPDNVAVFFENKTYSYFELNKQANKLAIFFSDNGIKPGDFIGIHLKRNVDVYIAMLAVLKCGAAYVPIDATYPADRVSFILEDSKAKFLISQSFLKNNHTDFKGKVLYTEYEIKVILNEDNNAENLNKSIPYTSPAYVIYTSGTTGKPKGVVIPHTSITNLIKAERVVFSLGSNEKIAQGFSVAFDASLEEIWLAFASGSTLYPVSEDAMHSGNDLSVFVLKHQLSVLSTVPTMLSMLNAPLPSLKLLILGGENCPNDLLLKWHRPDLRIVNTYGPTETTVIASYADFNEEEKITIGRPLINYAIFIVDSAQQICPVGVPGELCIAGLGLAQGYLNKNELTAEKFITPNFAINLNFEKRIYKSGDLARYNASGKIEFLGRIDSQVKLRGYRIELSEIENTILQEDNIKNAVVAVKEDQYKVQHLVAYLILNDKNNFNEGHLKLKLKSKLAVYMIPGLYLILDELPILPSGKVNRKLLPDIIQEKKTTQRNIIKPNNKSEETILETWTEFLHLDEISITDDFFDIGGHSLLASLVVSHLRKIKGFERISVQDIYTFRTIERLANYFDNDINKTEQKTNNKAGKTTKTSSLTYLTVVFMQVVSFFLFMLVTSTGLLGTFAIEEIYPDITPYKLIMYSSILVISTFPILIIVSIILKWIVIGKFKEGRYPLWGYYYFRFWFVKKFVDITPLGILSGTPFLNIYFRLMGAKIGKNVYLGSDRIRMFDLISIGNGSSISREAHLTGYTIENSELIIGSICLGENCFVGTRSALSPDTLMENNATLGELSLLSEGEKIPVNENWEGSPAKRIEQSKFETLFTTQKLKGMPYGVYIPLQFIAILFLMLFPLVLMVPFGLTFYELDLHYGFRFVLLAAIPFAAVYIVLFCVFIAAIKWLIIGKTKEEDFSIYSFRYIQKWTVDMILHFVLFSFKSIYATIYLPSWLRLMGAKIGKRAEISTVNQISTDLLEIGNESFLADSVSIGSPIVRNGVMFLRKTFIGSRTFIGNSAVIACGDNVGNDCLIGVLSVPPKNAETNQQNGTSWLGSPSVFLPKRQPGKKFDEKFTFNPTYWLFFKRGFIEFFKISLPFGFTIMLLALFYKLIYDVLHVESFSVVVLLAPFILTALFLVTPFITVIVKKVLIGKYIPDNKPLWSTFVWYNELVNSLCESMVYPLVVNMLLGTPLAPSFFRLMGSKIGKRVFMETTEITEFDLVNIEDEVCLNQLSTIQTHLFEDRVMKMSNLYIKKKCNVGAMSVVLYDATMEEQSSIEALS
ncbi:MAG: amino acid adenylation domain-containing protein, partial [Bacteroidia bacterium]|nr:amino acid adenylation domain-containing protein [Bacteroidia bacterium]